MSNRSTIMIHTSEPLGVECRVSSSGTRSITIGTWDKDQPETTYFVPESDPLFEYLRAYAAKQVDEELAAAEETNVDL